MRALLGYGRLIGVAGVMVAIASVHPAQTKLFEVSGDKILEDFGRALVADLDFDGDGIPNLVVGVPNEDPGGVSNAGAIYVYGSAIPEILHTWEGDTSSQNLGLDLLTPGDMNGDGADDVFSASGSLPLLFAGGSGETLGGFGIPGGSPGRLGVIADLDGDAIPELIVGDLGFSDIFNDQGRVDVVSGISGGILFSHLGAGPSDRLGTSVLGTGDMDGDGVPDFAAGATQTCSKFFCEKGYVVAYSGATGDVLFRHQGQIGQIGIALAAGDVNADGLADLIAGEHGCCFHPEVGGRVVVYDGSTGNELYSLIGPRGFGLGLAGPGDVNGDGYDDFVVGNPVGGTVIIGPITTNGTVTLVSGKDASVLFVFEQPNSSTEPDNLGLECVPAGDWNDDGFPDFAVGADGDSVVPGEATVFSGAVKGIRTFGTGCPGSAGRAPRIGYGAAPRLGADFALHVSDSLPGLAAALVIGVPSFPGGIPLFPDSTCALYLWPLFVHATLTTALGSGEGVATFAFTIPDDPTLLDKALFAQWFVLNPEPATVPAAATRGLEIVFQPKAVP